MDLVHISALYHLGGSNILIYLVAIYFVAVAASLTRWAPALLRTAGKFLMWAASGAGAAIGVALCVMEVVVFRLSCPLCLLASFAATAAFAALTFVDRRPARMLLLSGLLAITGFGFLFPIGGVPRIYRTNGTDLLGPQSHVLGDVQSAPLMVEFGDFECHACAMEDRAIDRIWPAYKDRLRYSFRHMPIRDLHPGAETAAIASECAGLDGRFWESKRVLFEHQGDVSSLAAIDVPATYSLHSGTQWQDCLGQNSPTHNAAASIVAQDEHDAGRLGLFATPSLLLGPYLIVGAMSSHRIGGVLDAAVRTSGTSGQVGTAGPVDSGATGCFVSPAASTASCSK